MDGSNPIACTKEFIHKLSIGSPLRIGKPVHIQGTA
jgi:hypothetical protein